MNWNNWILQKNAEFTLDKLGVSRQDVTEYLAKAPTPLGPHHAKSIESKLKSMGHKNVSVTDENPGNFSGLHVTFDSSDQDDHSDHVEHALKSLGISHKGVSSNDVEDYGNEHFIHS